MSRASSVYILFALIFAVGIWAILGFGSAVLTAPEDLAGNWSIDPSIVGKDGQSVDSLTIDQSGRFFELSFKDGRRFHLTLTRQETDDSSGTRPIRMLLRGAGCKLRIAGAAGADDFDFQLTGTDVPTDWSTFHARRTQRTYQPRT